MTGTNPWSVDMSEGSGMTPEAFERALAETSREALLRRASEDEDASREALARLFVGRAMRALIKARKDRGLTQEALATMLGTTQSAIARAEGDLRGSMSLRRFARWAIACNVMPILTFTEIGDARTFVLEYEQSHTETAVASQSVKHAVRHPQDPFLWVTMDPQFAYALGYAARAEYSWRGGSAGKWGDDRTGLSPQAAKTPQTPQYLLTAVPEDSSSLGNLWAQTPSFVIPGSPRTVEPNVHAA